VWKAVNTIPAWTKEIRYSDDDDDGDDAADCDDAADGDDGNCDKNSYHSSSYVSIRTEYLAAQKLGHNLGKFMENIILLFVTLS
jgi:hypothetical protein